MIHTIRTIKNLRKCINCPAFVKGSGTLRCRPCQDEHRVVLDKERKRQLRKKRGDL